MGKLVYNLEEAKQACEDLGFPVVVKPYAGNHGRGITTNINSQAHLEEAFDLAKEVSSWIIVEKFLKGQDYRVLVIDGKFEAAALRKPAMVVGDGKSTIKDLIDLANQDPRRGEGHANFLSKILIDEDTDFALEAQGLGLEDIIDKGREVYLKSTANISSGGSAEDVTDKVHPTNRLMVERISRIIGLNLMGVDIIAETLEESLLDQEAGIIEVNAGPGLRMHLNPSEGRPRNVAEPIVDMLFPEDKESSIPICAITGTNGKTTTTRLISHILNLAGRVVGMTSTDGVFVDNVRLQKGDFSGPLGAQTVMKDSTVDTAVLEVARGGILRRGLGFKECDVGVLLNVSSDHLGLGGVDSLEELSRVKGVVTESVKEGGYTVYNADDDLVVARSHLSKGRIIFFSKDKDNPHLKANLEKGNVNISLDDGSIILQTKDSHYAIAEINQIPITFEGRAGFNVENVMAAVGAAYGMGVDRDHVKAGLLSFSPTIGQTPGRMNFYDIGDIKVVIDYGHNVAAVQATGEFFRNIMPGRVIRIAEPTGDRRDQDVYEFGSAMAAYADYFIVADTAPRGRRLGETSLIVQEALLEQGIQPSSIEIINDEEGAVKRALDLAQPGDLVVLQIGKIKEVTDMILDFKESYLAKLKKENQLGEDK